MARRGQQETTSHPQLYQTLAQIGESSLVNKRYAPFQRSMMTQDTILQSLPSELLEQRQKEGKLPNSLQQQQEEQKRKKEEEKKRKAEEKKGLIPSVTSNTTTSNTATFDPVCHYKAER